MLKKCKITGIVRKLSAVLLVFIMIFSVSEGWWSRAAATTINVDILVGGQVIGTRPVQLNYVYSDKKNYVTVTWGEESDPPEGYVAANSMSLMFSSYSTSPRSAGNRRMTWESTGFPLGTYVSGRWGWSLAKGYYCVRYAYTDGSPISSITVKAGDDGECRWTHETAPQDPDNKTFLGWSTSKDSYVPADDHAPVSSFASGLLNLYAIYDTVTAVSFNANGGSGEAPSDITYSQYGSYTFPAADGLAKQGYTFMGWGEAFDSYAKEEAIYQPGDALTISEPADSKTFYAQWAKNYTINYDLNGSTSAPPQTSTAVAGPDGSVDITVAPSNGITKPGNTFEGFSTDPVSTTGDIAPGSTLTIRDDTTLYAVWTKKDYAISFDLNGAVNTPAPVLSDVTGYYNDTVTLPGPALIKDHYIFKGWCADRDGSGTVYTGGSSFTIEESTPQNLKLYAKWDDADPYTLAFDKGKDDVMGTPPSGGTYYNDSINDTVTLPASSLARAGYTFAGWTKTKGSNTVDYADAETFQITESMTLYPVWTAGTFTLDYDFNGGDDAVSEAVPGSIQEGPESPITTAPQGGMYRPHYRFTGWNTAANGTGAAYAPGSPVLLDHNITLYAQWEALDPVSVTYHTNCSDTLIQAPVDTKEYYADGINEDGSVTSVVLNRFGYNFKGWNTEANGTGTSYAAGADIKVTEDTDLYAVWAEGTYTLSYDKNGAGVTGDLPDSVTGKLNSIIRTGSGDNLDLKHHHFKEWNTASDGTGTGYQPGDKVSLGVDTTLYAVWEKNNYEITYSLNADDAQGTVPSKDSGAYDETFTAPSLDGISRPKYKPISWNDDPDGNGKDYTPGASYYFDDAKILFVKWEAVPPYEVHYFKNASDAAGTPPEDNNTYCEDGVTPTSVTVLDQNDLKRPGYEFAGWNTKPNGTGLTYQPGDDFIIKTHMNFYAQWKIGTYTLNFDKGHSAVTGSGPAALSSRSDKDIILPKEGSFKRKDFGFTGWNTKADGSGTFYKAGSKLKILEDTTIYAQWKRLVNVSFDNSDGALKGDTSLQVTEGTKLGDVKLPSVNSGYTVKEWIINGQKVTDYKNYVVDEDSDVVLVLEKKKDPAPAPKPTPGGDTNPDKPDKDNPNGGNGGSSGGNSGNNGGNGSSSGGGSNSDGSDGSGTDNGGSGSGSGNGGSSSSSANAGGSGSSALPGSSEGLQSSEFYTGKAAPEKKQESGSAAYGNSASAGKAGGTTTILTDEQVPLSSGKGLIGQSGSFAYGPIKDCLIHWLILLGFIISSVYTFLRGRHIRRKELLQSAFTADTLIPMLAVPLCGLAWIYRSCRLDFLFIIVWLIFTAGNLYYLHRAYKDNQKKMEEAIAQL